MHFIHVCVKNQEQWCHLYECYCAGIQVPSLNAALIRVNISNCRLYILGQYFSPSIQFRRGATKVIILVDISFNLWTCPVINSLRWLSFPVIVFDGNILETILDRVSLIFIYHTKSVCVCHVFPVCIILLIWFALKLSLEISSQASDVSGIRSDGTVSVFMLASIWSKPYLEQYYLSIWSTKQYYLMSDRRSYLRIWRSCSLRSTQYRSHQHHLHSHQDISNSCCRYSPHNKQPEHLRQIKLCHTTFHHISPNIERWDDKHIVHQLTVSPSSSSASEDNWQLSDNTM